MSVRRKTRGRRMPFAKCSHVGYGSFCHRCSDAQQILDRLEEVSKLGLGKATEGEKLPYLGKDYLKAGGIRFNPTQGFEKLGADMKKEAERLFARREEGTKAFVISDKPAV